MADYQQNLQEETAYLVKTVDVIKRELASEVEKLLKRKEKVIASRRDMWENGVHFVEDFDRLVELNQYLSEVNNQTVNYHLASKRVDEYRRIMGSPYFGRFDFRETGAARPVYIGLHNVIDSSNHQIYVHDWRAPISSIFYRYELGRAQYEAPGGVISGDVVLKRQYKITNSRLDYFFDCSVRINDEVLQKVLSRHASPRMRNIVETIQREQDMIIRDADSELLIVQGVAGSGKTAIVLHRVAFLLYEGLNTNLRSNDVVMVSPNAVFGQYISEVLPELGEESVHQTTFDDIVRTCFGDRFVTGSREIQIESMINSREHLGDNIIRQSIDFKGSKVFMQILDRFLWYYGHRVIRFEDIYYNGMMLETRQNLKNRFLNNKTGMPMAKQLKRLEGMIMDKVRPLQKRRLKAIEKVIANIEGHELEVKSFSRLLSIKEAGLFMRRIHRFTEVDYWDVYKTLFSENRLFFKIADGLELPADIERIILETRLRLEKGRVSCEDSAPLLYLMLKMEGSSLFSEIKQVLIDEAQDYYPIHYEVFNLLFAYARFTVLGDVNQVIEKDAGVPFYEDVSAILNKGETVTLFLNRSYRSSFEITQFTQKLLGKGEKLVAVERHEAEPRVVSADNVPAIDSAIAEDISCYFEQGYESVAIICKTLREAKELSLRLKPMINVRLVGAGDAEIERGALVLPSYMVRGLEFDVVLVYGVNRENYSTDMDKKLLYLACTRALHRLVLYYSGEKSPLLQVDQMSGDR